MPSVDEVEEALTNVIDPELGLDFVELGLVYEIEVDEGDVNITFTLTSPGCPIGPQVSDQMKEFVSELDGVETVTPNMTFSPPWTPDLMSEDAKFALRCGRLGAAGFRTPAPRPTPCPALLLPATSRSGGRSRGAFRGL